MKSLNGVMLNAYPDSIGHKLSDCISILERPEFEGVFSLFYILPTFFHSDLDRGFSVIDYDINEELVLDSDLERIRNLNIQLKFDLVLNHLSVGSPQFQDLIQKGDQSQYRDFFIDWNEFWEGHGSTGEDGVVIPKEEFLNKLFMRKPDLPILKVRFPDGSERPYWNTFYQKISYTKVSAQQLIEQCEIEQELAERVCALVNKALDAGVLPQDMKLGIDDSLQQRIVDHLESNQSYLGQMDLNASSEKVWDFYTETFEKLNKYGASLIRLDAFAYLHKQPGEVNFFNTPGTWDYLNRLKEMAEQYDLALLPEIHAEYGKGLHEEVSESGFPVYDFFLPGLVIDALDRGTSSVLLRWIHEILSNGLQTVNMLGCHDGIPVLDLKGIPGKREGLLADKEIEVVIEKILARGGRVKNLYGADGKKISYYQVNATFFSALGEDEQKLRLARAIQIFMPGIPQVWYLDLFAGKNDYEAANLAGEGGHKEINRTTIELNQIEEGLKRDIVRDQLALLRLRNLSLAFLGELTVEDTADHTLHLIWRNDTSIAELQADLKSYQFSVRSVHDGEEMVLEF
jgi:sucrose phosphorylase